MAQQTASAFQRAALAEIRKALERATKQGASGRRPDGLIECESPVTFAKEWLGLELWPRQEEILVAIATKPRVAVRSGHKIGKSSAAAIAALWWVSTQAEARVVLTAPTSRQVEAVLWREVVRLYRLAEQRGKSLGGTIYTMADRGLVYPDQRQVFGFSTDKSDRFDGLSGNLLLIEDEASGVSDAIDESMEGNRAGGGGLYGDERDAGGKISSRRVMFSNPRSTAGHFYRAFRDPRERQGWHQIHVSSEEVADWQAERGEKLGYLATKGWVAEKKKQWGESSPLFYVRVLGDFAPRSEAGLISLESVENAKERWLRLATLLGDQVGRDLTGIGEVYDPDDYKIWEEARLKLLDAWNTLSEEDQKLVATLRQPLRLGVDVAWFGNDLSAITPRRGDFVYPLLCLQSMDGPTVAQRVRLVALALRQAVRQQDLDQWAPGWNERPTDERVIAQFDSIGNGASAFDAARQQHSDVLQAVGVCVSEKATDDESEKLRDQVWCAVRDFLKDGGMLPPNEFLEAELLAVDYGPSPRGKLKVDDKDTIKKKLPEDRSPDRADSMCLCVYQAAVFNFGVGTFWNGRG